MEFTSLKYANKKLRQEKYDDALFIYQELSEKNPYLFPILKFNIDYCKYKIGENKEFLDAPLDLLWEENAEAAVLKNFGAGLLGPLFLMFFQRLSKANFGDARKIFFFGREGYFLTQAYESLVKHQMTSPVDAVYLTISRRFLFKLCLIKPEMIEMSLERSYAGSIEDFLEDRYGFSSSEIKLLCPLFHKIGVFAVTLPVDNNLISQVFQENKKILEAMISPKYWAYKDYLEDQGVFEPDVVNCLDLGYSGTTQRILGRLYDLKTNGHYFFTTENAMDGENDKYIGYILNRDKIRSGNAFIERSSYVESVLTAPVGTLLDIKKEGASFDFVYDKKMRPQIYFDAIELIAQGAIEYAKKNYTYEAPMSYEDLLDFYTSFVNSKNSFPQKVQEILEMDDAISGIDNLNPVKYFLG
ncbi:hypothetical protein [Comamonas thiooxydans]|uniref:hypothetical protein n=1 Tax=Comamonas thiooxydans TaxID=363952 RepID=UPI000B40974B|nr:hypothetical protein [Comamonas thiooxydans]